MTHQITLKLTLMNNHVSALVFLALPLLDRQRVAGLARLHSASRVVDICKCRQHVHTQRVRVHVQICLKRYMTVLEIAGPAQLPSGRFCVCSRWNYGTSLSCGLSQTFSDCSTGRKTAAIL